jgi:hypothetical protein
MRTRVVLVAGVWASIVVAAFALFGGAAAPLGLAVAAVGLVAGVASARRHDRFRPWDSSRRRRATPSYPPGPRRVPIAETGLVLPR